MLHVPFGNGSSVALSFPPRSRKLALTVAHAISQAEPCQIVPCDPKNEPKTSRRLGPPSPQAQLLSPKQAADWLGVSRSTVDRMIADGRLEFVLLRQGKRKRLIGISKNALERLKKKG